MKPESAQASVVGCSLPWTTAEEEILWTFARTARGFRKARALLGHRSTAALRKRVQLLGVPRPHRAWTSEEDRILRLDWGEDVPRTLRRKLPGRSWHAIMLRAETLGLERPQREMVSLDEAARRAGYSPKTLRAILNRYGVALESYRHGRHAEDIGALRRQIPSYRVDPVEVEDAVRKHLADAAADRRETVREAAARLGVGHMALYCRLRRAGALPKEGRGRKALLEPGVADRFVRPGVARCGAATREQERAA